MDQRVVFVIVFLFTLMSTVLVAITSFITGQSLIATVLYSLATMWVIGILSQILLQNLYFSVVKPREEEPIEMDDEDEDASLQKINLEEVEEIDDLQRQLKGNGDEKMEREKALSSSPEKDVRG